MSNIRGQETHKIDEQANHNNVGCDDHQKHRILKIIKYQKEKYVREMRSNADDDVANNGFKMPMRRHTTLLQLMEGENAQLRHLFHLEKAFLAGYNGQTEIWPINFAEIRRDVEETHQHGRDIELGAMNLGYWEYVEKGLQRRAFDGEEHYMQWKIASPEFRTLKCVELRSLISVSNGDACKRPKPLRRVKAYRSLPEPSHFKLGFRLNKLLRILRGRK